MLHYRLTAHEKRWTTKHNTHSRNSKLRFDPFPDGAAADYDKAVQLKPDMSDAYFGRGMTKHAKADLEGALADYGKTKEDIANAFHVPLSFLTSETNLANLQAAEHQHMAKAIFPRLQRRDEKINEQLLPLYDPSGRLFVASEDPVPFNQEIAWRQQEIDLKYGILTINEVRQDRGLPSVPWGDTPWLPIHWLPSDFPDRAAYAPDSGRAKEPTAD